MSVQAYMKVSDLDVVEFITYHDERGNEVRFRDMQGVERQLPQVRFHPEDRDSYVVVDLRANEYWVRELQTHVTMLIPR